MDISTIKAENLDKFISQHQGPLIIDI